ncbi:MAG TPA: glycoside hydrolase family 30 beta sandwich domain-containing protein [Solirubrobacteraceae bacterium]|nr:glycoside hydrolase family 30 beta sandwich domain-containing protein [Solirubrobacteraceae bacterium]
MTLAGIGPGAGVAGATADVGVEVLETGPGSAQALVPSQIAFSSRSDPTTASSAAIRVDDSTLFQPVWGVGAAMTNSSAFLIDGGLTPSQRQALIGQLFGPSGDRLTVLRISLGGSDFNAGGIRYSEDDMPPGQSDPQLRHFSLRHDQDTIRMLRLARAVNPHLRIIASPWTAPAWMKTNGSLDDSTLSGELKQQDYAVYAQYVVRFVKGYRDAGVPIFALTAQNEPVGVPAKYEGMFFPVAHEAQFVRTYLRPALRRAGLTTAIYGPDEGWDRSTYAKAEISQAGGLSGLAWHCYAGNPDDVMPHFGSMTQIMSECAPSLIRSPVGSLLSNVFNDGANAALLWNIALDPSGGPVVPPNSGCPGCAGLVTIDPGARATTYGSAFYELAQFGRFLLPGAHRIAATRLGHFESGGDGASPGIHDVAFRNRDGSDVLVVFNNSSDSFTFSVRWRGLGLVHAIPGQTIVTLRWPAG